MPDLSILKLAVAFAAAILLGACASRTTPTRADATSCAVLDPRAALAALPPPRLQEGALISAADLRSDFAGWLAGLREVNADPELRIDRPGFERMRSEIESGLVAPMSERQAWQSFARLTPFLRDGHSGLLIKDYRQRAADYQRGGGRLLPFEVAFADDGGLRVRAAAMAQAVPTGSRVLAINGRSADEIVAAMLERTEGDTPEFRRALVARRFALLYWMLYGDTERYVVETAAPGACPQLLTLLGSDVPPSRSAANEFSSAVFEGGIGYLKAGSFGAEYREDFAAFSKKTFAEFKAQGIRALIVDVRDNAGGDDDLWQNGLMEYLTDKPYIHVSGFAKRVPADDVKPGERAGDVRRSAYDKRITPSAHNPLRFAGPVYVLKGPFTYSAAIQFVVAAQDFGIAKIAGRESGALGCQTGRVTDIAMPKTGLRAFTPSRVFIRPSGSGCANPVRPDVIVDDDGVDPARAPALLAATIRATL